jgi:hypothetical protein
MMPGNVRKSTIISAEDFPKLETFLDKHSESISWDPHNKGRDA